MGCFSVFAKHNITTQNQLLFVLYFGLWYYYCYCSTVSGPFSPSDLFLFPSFQSTPLLSSQQLIIICPTRIPPSTAQHSTDLVCIGRINFTNSPPLKLYSQFFKIWYLLEFWPVFSPDPPSHVLQCAKYCPLSSHLSTRVLCY